MVRTRFEGADLTLDSVPPEQQSPASASVIEINGKNFVSNLFWQPLSNPRSYMKEAREQGKKNNWNVVAIRKSAFRIQAGFVSKESGAIKGMYSLAASLAGVLGDQWIGAFRLKDGRYAVVALDKGSVIPGYDEIVVSRESALAKLQEGINLGQFSEGQIYAPSDFEFARQERDIASLLQPKLLKARYKLKPLTFGLTAKEIAAICGAVAIAVGLLVAYHQFERYQERKAQQERIRQAQEREAELKKLNGNTAKTQTVAALKHPWASMPSAWDVITTCTEKMKSFPLSLGGWQFDTASCDSTGIAVEYKRPEAGTTIKEFKSASNLEFAAYPAVFTGAEKARFGGMPWKAKFTGDEPIASLDETMVEFNSHFQQRDVKVEIKEKPYELPKPPEAVPGVETPQAVPDWKQFIFEYSDKLSPVNNFDPLRAMNALRITSITVSLDNNKAELMWNVKGEIYGK